MIANTLLARWRGGQIELSDATSVTAYGRREAGLSVGDIGDIDAVVQAADTNLSVTKDPTDSAIAKMWDLASSGHSAYVDYLNGDTVTLAAISADVAVASITVAEDENGYLDVTPEFITARDVLEQRVNRWLARTNDGALGGRTATTAQAAISSDSILSSSVATPSVIPMGGTGGYELVTGDEAAPAKTPDIEGFLYVIELDANAAGIADTDIDITVNGTTVCTATLAASSVATVYDLDSTEVLLLEFGDMVRAVVASAGGHSGVSIRCLVASTEI